MSTYTYLQGLYLRATVDDVVELQIDLLCSSDSGSSFVVDSVADVVAGLPEACGKSIQIKDAETGHNWSAALAAARARLEERCKATGPRVVAASVVFPGRIVAVQFDAPISAVMAGTVNIRDGDHVVDAFDVCSLNYFVYTIIIE